MLGMRPELNRYLSPFLPVFQAAALLRKVEANPLLLNGAALATMSSRTNVRNSPSSTTTSSRMPPPNANCVRTPPNGAVCPLSRPPRPKPSFCGTWADTYPSSSALSPPPPTLLHPALRLPRLRPPADARPPCRRVRPAMHTPRQSWPLQYRTRRERRSVCHHPGTGKAGSRRSERVMTEVESRETAARDGRSPCVRASSSAWRDRTRQCTGDGCLDFDLRALRCAQANASPAVPRSRLMCLNDSSRGLPTHSFPRRSMPSHPRQLDQCLNPVQQ